MGTSFPKYYEPEQLVKNAVMFKIVILFKKKKNFNFAAAANNSSILLLGFDSDCESSKPNSIDIDERLQTF